MNKTRGRTIMLCVYLAWLLVSSIAGSMFFMILSFGFGMGHIGLWLTELLEDRE